MLNVHNVPTIRHARAWARSLDPARVILLLGLVLTCLAACGPGSGSGPAY